jgi:hypothetical protein
MVKSSPAMHLVAVVELCHEDIAAKCVAQKQGVVVSQGLLSTPCHEAGCSMLF